MREQQQKTPNQTRNTALKPCSEINTAAGFDPGTTSKKYFEGKKKQGYELNHTTAGT
jgi:hypothetical protein